MTVTARSAAAADVAATLIANAVDLPGHSGVVRRPAAELDPGSDLGQRPATVAVGRLADDEIAAALAAGAATAAKMAERGLIEGAVLFLAGQSRVVSRAGTSTGVPARIGASARDLRGAAADHPAHTGFPSTTPAPAWTNSP